MDHKYQELLFYESPNLYANTRFEVKLDMHSHGSEVEYFLDMTNLMNGRLLTSYKKTDDSKTPEYNFGLMLTDLTGWNQSTFSSVKLTFKSFLDGYKGSTKVSESVPRQLNFLV